MLSIPAYVPYLLLTAACIVFTAIAWLQTKSLKLIPFYIGVAGAIYMFELVIFILLDSYEYMPGILNNRYYDSSIGAVISNGLIIPATCSLIVIYDLRFRWILLIAAGFMGIEQLFIVMGIFEHHWWKLIYTGLGLTILFSIGKWYWRKLNQPTQPYLFHLIALYIINVSLQGSIIFFYLIFYTQLEYRPGWFENASRDNVAFASILVHIDSILFALLISLRGNWLWKALLLGLLGIGFAWLYQRGILQTSGIGPIILVLLLQLVIIQLLGWMNRILPSKPYGEA